MFTDIGGFPFKSLEANYGQGGGYGGGGGGGRRNLKF